MLFLFSVNDCGTCLNFLNQMDYFAKVYKNIRFIAVLSETDTLVYEKIKKQYDLCFDMLLDSEKRLKKYYVNDLLYKHKPVVFVTEHGIIRYKGILGVPKYSNIVKEILIWIKNRGKQG
ncbi:redoxin domain-containing protein [bacterium]|nr:redoxin domain-containing protein [bacterium]